MRHRSRHPLIHSMRIVAFALFTGFLVLILAGVAPFTVVYAAGHATPSSHPHPIHNKRDLQGEAAWYTLKHFGHTLPSPQARALALRQAQRDRKGSFAAASAVSPATSIPQNSTWTALGPAPLLDNSDGSLNSGRVTALAVDPNDSTHVWLGGADGGLWESHNSGQTWYSISDNTSVNTPGGSIPWPTLSIGSIAVDPTNSQNIYIGTGEANFNFDGYGGIGLLKSTDGGLTWTQYGASLFGGLSMGRIAIDPVTPNVVLLAVSLDNDPLASASAQPGPGVSPTNIGVWRSTDGGITWTQTVNLDDAGTDLTLDPTNHSDIYAGLAGSNSVNSGIYRSSDNGVTFSRLSSSVLPQGQTVGRLSLAMSPDGSWFYSVAADASGALYHSTIYVSDHTGASWTQYDVTTNQAMTTDDSENQWNYKLALAVDPTNGAHVLLGGTSLWESTDSGADWNAIASGIHADQHAIAFFSRTSAQYYLGNDGGVWSYSGGSFTDLNATLNITQFYSGSVGTAGGDAQLYGGAQDNGEIQYPGGSPSSLAQWTEVDGGDGGDTAVDYTNNAVVYEEYTYGAMSKSTNGGATWASTTSGLYSCDTTQHPVSSTCNPTNFVMPFVLSPTNNNELFAGTDRVYKSTDGGTSWSNASGQTLDNGAPISALAAAPSNDQYVYAGDNYGDIYLSSDGGVTWSRLYLTVPAIAPVGGIVTGLAVDPTSASTVYATFSAYADCNNSSNPTYPCGQHVFKSTDSGNTWTDISNCAQGGLGVDCLPNAPVESIAISPLDPNTVIVGTDVGIFYTSDGGPDWVQLGSNFPDVSVDQIFTDHGGANLYVATHGRGMWKLPLVGGHVYVGGTGGALSLNANDGSSAWQYNVRAYNGIGEGEPSATLANGTLYYVDFVGGSTPYALFALNASTGALLWQYPLAAVTDDTPTVANGLVYVGAEDNYLYAVNATTGALAWRSSMSGYAAASPTVAGTSVYVQTSTATLYALEASTGALVWSKGLLKKPTASSGSAAAVANGILYIGSPDGVIYALNASTGRSVWSYATGATQCACATPVVVNGVVYASGNDGYMDALNASTGAVVWRDYIQTSGSIGASQPTTAAVVNGVVYFGDYDTTSIYAVSAATGATIWIHTRVAYQAGWWNVPVVMSGVVYDTEGDGGGGSYVWALRASDGGVMWSSPILNSSGLVNTNSVAGV